MAQTAIRAEIDASLLERLDSLCTSWQRSRSEVIEEALVGYLDWNDTQMAHIRAGIGRRTGVKRYPIPRSLRCSRNGAAAANDTGLHWLKPIPLLSRP